MTYNANRHVNDNRRLTSRPDSTTTPPECDLWCAAAGTGTTATSPTLGRHLLAQGGALEHPQSSVTNVVTHIKDRLGESETLQQQARNNTLAQFSASPDLHNEFVGAVIGAMESSEDLSTQILNNHELLQKLPGRLIPIIYRGLKDASLTAHRS